jgi:hypothetical protein
MILSKSQQGQNPNCGQQKVAFTFLTFKNQKNAIL